MDRRFLIGPVLAFAAMSMGCGGGGASATGAVRSTGLFVTDSLNTSFDHVWVTIEKVTFDGTKGAVVAYDNPAGAVVDLKTLRDASGAKFSMLGTLALPADTYGDVKVVLDKTLTLVPTGSTTGVTRTFAGFDAATGTMTLTFNFSPPKAITADFAIDFDLANWVDDGTSVTAVIKEADPSGIGTSDRNVPDDYRGVLSGLGGTIPNQTFTFTSHEGFIVSVATSATTSIFNSDGSLNPALAEGQHIVLRGILDPTTHTFDAASIMILIGNPSETHASGAPSAGNATAGTFTLAVSDVEGFVPTGVNITVQTTSTTKFFNSAGTSIGLTDFFTSLATAMNVHVNGSFDAASQTMTALSIRLEGGSDSNEAEVQGAVSNGNGASQTFDIVATEFEGCNVAPGATIHALVTGTTQLIGPDRSALSNDAFFLALAAATGAEVEGAYDSTSQTLTASRVQLHSQSTASQSSVDGSVSNVDGTGHTFSLTAQQWEDAQLSVGQVLNITTDANTVYRDSVGNTMTQDAFFTALANAPKVRVEGPLNGSSINAHLARILQ